MVRRTLPFSPIWGLIFRVMPTSLRSMVWNGLEELLLVVVYEPVTKGTFWPTTILASSLSSVITLAVDRMLVPDMVSRADAMVPNVSVVLLLMLNSCDHCTPRSRLLLASTSTTSDSTYSCERGASSWSITLRISRKRGSEAVRISELVLGSAWMPPPVRAWPRALPEGCCCPCCHCRCCRCWRCCPTSCWTRSHPNCPAPCCHCCRRSCWCCASCRPRERPPATPWPAWWHLHSAGAPRAHPPRCWGGRAGRPASAQRPSARGWRRAPAGCCSAGPP